MSVRTRVESIPGQKDATPPAPKSGVDYRDLLSTEDFSLFLRLKELRTSLSESAGVPVYAVFTNEQLAEIVRTKPVSLANLQEIRGIGEAKAKSYGQAFLDLLSGKGRADEADRPSDK